MREHSAVLSPVQPALLPLVQPAAPSALRQVRSALSSAVPARLWFAMDSVMMLPVVPGQAADQVC